jgi:hypothetical protein
MPKRSCGAISTVGPIESRAEGGAHRPPVERPPWVSPPFFGAKTRRRGSRRAASRGITGRASIAHQRTQANGYVLLNHTCGKVENPLMQHAAMAPSHISAVSTSFWPHSSFQILGADLVEAIIRKFDGTRFWRGKGGRRRQVLRQGRNALLPAMTEAIWESQPAFGECRGPRRSASRNAPKSASADCGHGACSGFGSFVPILPTFEPITF